MKRRDHNDKNSAELVTMTLLYRIEGPTGLDLPARLSPSSVTINTNSLLERRNDIVEVQNRKAEQATWGAVKAVETA